MSLEWYCLGRTGTGDGDQDADLPGARWAQVGKDGREFAWSWTICEYDEFENVAEIAGGYGDTEEAVKLAVETWVKSDGAR